MKHVHPILGAIAMLALLLPGTASAIGTPSGTIIANTATATYGIGTQTGLTAPSNTVNITVQQVTDVVVTAMNSPITVNPGDQGRIAIFRVTNTGNGSDTFNLAPNSTIPAGDQFDPILSAPNSVAIDTNGNGIYDPGTDVYATATTALAADTYTTVFVFNNIDTYAANPAIVDGATGLTEVTATSQTASGIPGTLIGGPGGAVVGGNGGTGTARATYTVSSVVVNIAKTSAITADPYSVAPPFQAIPGATVRYTLNVTITGTGTANNVVITDPIPANTTYVPGSMTLNTVALTDVADADAGDFNVSNPGAVTISLGNLTAASPAQTITFSVTIN